MPLTLSPAIPLLWRFVIDLPQLQATSAGMTDFVCRGPLYEMPVTQLPLFRYLSQSDLAAQWCARVSCPEDFYKHKRKQWTLRCGYRVHKCLHMQHDKITGDHLLQTTETLVPFLWFSIFCLSLRRWVACGESDVNKEIWNQTCHLTASEINTAPHSTSNLSTRVERAWAVWVWKAGRQGNRKRRQAERKEMRGRKTRGHLEG